MSSSISDLVPQLMPMMQRLIYYQDKVEWFAALIDASSHSVNVKGGHRGKIIIVTWKQGENYSYSWDGRQMGRFRSIPDLMDDWEVIAACEELTQLIPSNDFSTTLTDLQ